MAVYSSGEIRNSLKNIQMKPSVKTSNNLLSELHPIFYGCFDWHSSVHGHWLLARALQLFPRTELAENITAGQTDH